jgi:hypothetical protein
MIAFQTLLLGLIFGRIPIQLIVTPPVARVEVRLDGVAIGSATGPPWTVEHDFGAAPLPHRLTAVGFDRSGRQVARTERWLNFGREQAEVSVALQRDGPKGRPEFAAVAWNAVVSEPPAVTATLDGAAVPVRDPRRIALPRVDLGTTHLLSVEVEFGKGLSKGADVAFGGDVADTAETELTAIAVVRPAGLEPLRLGPVRHLFSVDSAPTAPVAIETGIAEVALVYDDGVWETARERATTMTTNLSWAFRLGPTDDRFFVVSPSALLRHDASGRHLLMYPQSPPVRLAGLGDLRVVFSVIGGMRQQRAATVATAVATAGAAVAARSHRRAVVLLLAKARAAGTEPAHEPGPASSVTGGREADALTIAAARAYLAALRVPLVVWSLAGPAAASPAAPWGAAEEVSSGKRLRAAVKRLRARLDSQEIVWFAGRHLPQDITLDESATGLRLAR